MCALVSRPDLVTLHMQAYLEFSVGSFADAEAALARAFNLAPDQAIYVFDAGFVHWARQDYAQARDAFLQAAALRPGFADALYNAAAAELRRGCRGAAVTLILAALRRDPTLAWRGIGALWSAWRGRPQIELVSRRAWAVPGRDLPEVQDALAEAHSRLGQLDKAVAAGRRAVAAKPTARRHYSLGNTLRTLGDVAGAERCFADTLRLEPLHRDARLGLVWTDIHQDRYEQARRRILAYQQDQPDDPYLYERLLFLDSRDGRLTAVDDDYRAMLQGLRQPALLSLPMVSHFLYRSMFWPLPRPAYEGMARLFDQELVKRATARGAPLCRKGPADPTGRRLRIGYLSEQLGDHPIGHVTAGLWPAHDRSRFEVHVFSCPVRMAEDNPYTRSYKQGAEHSYAMDRSRTVELAQIIRSQEIDILVFLDGYMSMLYAEVMAMRPAPVQVFWLGHAGGCELSCIDYLIADATVVPPGEEQLYRAKVVRLPDIYHCASPHPIANGLTRVEAGLPVQGFVFCAFNNPEKLSREAFDAWMRILAAVDGSVLWLSDRPGSQTSVNLRARAEDLGIAGDRLIFAKRLPDKAMHLARHKLCGLFLDTLTLNASTTALDALWSGLPLVTVQGNRFASRIASTMLQSIGLDDMICRSLAEYEAKAVALAKDPAALATVARRLTDNRDTWPLFAIERFCRNLESAFDTMWQHHAAGHKPAGFDLSSNPR
jgi:tetratricopeptide (TPR) repeat protein